MINVPQFHEELERMGEERVRNNVSLRVWGKDHHGLAEEWLENRSQARKDASSLELVRIARSAKNASWAAAIAAIIAALIAIASAVIAYIALQATWPMVLPLLA